MRYAERRLNDPAARGCYQGPLTRVDRQKGGGARRPALYKVLVQP